GLVGGWGSVRGDALNRGHGEGVEDPRATFGEIGGGGGKLAGGDFGRDVGVLLQQLPVSSQAAEEDRRQQRHAQKRFGSGAQSVERGDEVAAVHGRNSGGLERLERMGVIPVVEVASIFGQAVHGGEALLGKVAEFRNREKAEPERGLARVQQQAEVGGRDAGGFDKVFFLDVIGNEIIVAGSSVFKI